jgi:hypothetical protein
MGLTKISVGRQGHFKCQRRHRSFKGCCLSHQIIECFCGYPLNHREIVGEHGTPAS